MSKTLFLECVTYLRKTERMELIIMIMFRQKLFRLKNSRHVGKTGEEGVGLISLYKIKHASEWYFH